MNFEFNLSLVLGHSILFEQKQSVPLEVEDSFRAQGDPPAASTGESTAAQLQAYIQYLPQLLNTTANSTLPVGQATQAASAVLSPEQQALQDQLFAEFYPQLQGLGDQLNASESGAGITQASNNLSGAGGNLISQAIAADEQANPEYYAARSQAGSKLSDLLNSVNLNGLTGSETAQVQRSNAQQDAQRGILASPSQTATVSNAMNFGTALQTKQANLASAISSASSFLPNSQSGVNAFAIGSGSATTPQSNPGTSQFLGTGSNATNTAASNTATGTSLLGDINSTATNAANIDANRRNSLDQVNATLSSLPT